VRKNKQIRTLGVILRADLDEKDYHEKAMKNTNINKSYLF